MWTQTTLQPQRMLSCVISFYRGFYLNQSSVFGVCFSLDCLQPEWSCVSGNWQLFSLSEWSRNKQEHCHCCCRWRARIILANYSELFLIDKSIYINFIALVDLVKQVSYLDTNKTVLCCDDALFFFIMWPMYYPDQQICLCLQSFKCWDNSVCAGFIKVYFTTFVNYIPNWRKRSTATALHCESAKSSKKLHNWDNY